MHYCRKVVKVGTAVELDPHTNSGVVMDLNAFRMGRAGPVANPTAAQQAIGEIAAVAKQP